MDMTLIVMLVIAALFVIGGPIVGYFATKASEKAEKLEKEKANQSKSS